MVAHQRSLFATGDPAIATDVTVERIALDERSWVDVARNWLRGADAMLDTLVDTVDWHQGRRRMWDRMVDDPRLSYWCRDGDPLPHPAFATVRSALAERYSVPFGTVGLNYYRDGDDSVAPHSDRELRDSTTHSSRSSRSELGARSCSGRKRVKKTVGGLRSILRPRPATCS